MSVFNSIVQKYKGELFYTLATYSTPIITMATNMVAAAFLNPEELGIIQSVVLVLPYISFAHFGVFNGLNRNLAFYKAQGNLQKVQDMVNASVTVARFNAVVGLLIGLGFAFYYIFNSYATIYILSSFLLLLNLVLNPLTLHYDTTYRSGQNFKTLGKITLVENALYAMANFLPILMGYVGKIVANALKVFSRFLLRYYTKPYAATQRGQKQDIIELSKVGIPLLLGGYLWGILVVSDQTMIAQFLGPKDLGYYSLSVFMMSGIILIPTSLNSLFYPKASAQYGKSQNNKALRTFYWKALLINIAILFPLCIFLYLTIEPLTAYFIPKYLPGIPSAKINLLTCLTFISNGPSIIMGVVKKNTPLLVAYALMLGFMWVMGFITPKENLSIEFIAWLRFFSSLILSFFTLIYCYYLTSKNEFNS